MLSSSLPAGLPILVMNVTSLSARGEGLSRDVKQETEEEEDPAEHGSGELPCAWQTQCSAGKKQLPAHSQA